VADSCGGDDAAATIGWRPEEVEERGVVAEELRRGS
jgi:hypothetical protein